MSTGHGFYFSEYRCEDCGMRKRIDHPNKRSYEVVIKPEDLGRCAGCNGKVTEEAKPRCPKCGSLDLAVDESSAWSID